MKITKQTLKQIIKEEYNRLLEADAKILQFPSSGQKNPSVEKEPQSSAPAAVVNMDMIRSSKEGFDKLVAKIAELRKANPEYKSKDVIELMRSISNEFKQSGKEDPFLKLVYDWRPNEEPGSVSKNIKNHIIKKLQEKEISEKNSIIIFNFIHKFVVNRSYFGPYREVKPTHDPGPTIKGTKSLRNIDEL